MDTKILQCRYWCVSTKRCTKDNNGLFIPMEEHVTRLCTTSNFCQCPQFQLNQTCLKEEKIYENRRNAVRFNQRGKITFSTLRHSTLPPETAQKQKGSTLDISSEGMRLFTPIPLSENSLIEFFFDEELLPELPKNRGKVRWCKRQTDTPGYQIGIAFTEN